MSLRLWEEVQEVPRQSVTPQLSKRERVLKTFAGEEVDRRPFTFWFPFGLSHMKGESLAAASLSFAATYGMELLRFPLVRDLPMGKQVSIDRPHDLTGLEVLPAHFGFWSERMEALRLARKMSDKKVALFETIPGPWTALSYLCNRDLLEATEKSNPNFLEKALTDVTASLKNYLGEILSKDWVDGIVVEIESASYELRTPESFETAIKPHLKEMLNHITQESTVPIWLQARGNRVYLDPLFELPHQMVSWPHLSSGPKLENSLPKGYKGRVAGALNEVAISEMSFQDIRMHVEEARNQHVHLFSVGDQLPADISPRRLAALANFLQKRDRPPE
jgi:uroporphyrinogen-III decarboxylase